MSFPALAGVHPAFAWSAKRAMATHDVVASSDADFNALAENFIDVAHQQKGKLIFEKPSMTQFRLHATFDAHFDAYEHAPLR
ncbi:hypothetical protein [Aureimonas altamirensis]|uniref:hypothetical protein n=1 Tax=Aureimonas altamirensis TaxID=370622 RepID=UPI0011610438|nr:hypothetical protein [Aureimonas altamirensis]